MSEPIDNKEAPSRLDRLLTCQPVFTRNQDVDAVAVIHQRHDGGPESSIMELQATLAAVLGTYNHIFKRGRIRTVPVFLPMTAELLLQPDLPTLPHNQFILDIDVQVDATPELVERLWELIGRGYRIAMRDPDLAPDQLRPLLDNVHVIKVDALLERDRLAVIMDRYQCSGIAMMACGINSPEQFRTFAELGFRYFQGNFLGYPTPVPGRKLSNNKQLLLQLLVELQNPNVTTARLEQLVIQDAHLTYRILRIVNSAALGIGRTVESLSHAFALLGTEEIKRWANLLLVDNTNDKPEQLTHNMLVRGRMCELLAQLLGHPSPTDHFITGLLSQLDALTDIDMEDLMSQVPLSQSIKDALLYRKGVLGEILRETEHYERGEFDQLQRLRDRALYEVAYRHSTAWANRIQLSITG